MTNNLAIWNSAKKTDPAYTKSYKGASGFSGTATNATWLAKRATEVFGPCGAGWGMTVVDTRVYDVGEEKLHVLQCELWFINPSDGVRGSVTCFGQTKMVTKRQSVLFLDDEAPKKSLTDAMSEGLSLLGFAADIHMGMFDDSRYVNEFGREYKEAKAEAKAAGEAAPVSVPGTKKRTSEQDAAAIAKVRAMREDAEKAAAADNVVPLTKPAVTDAHDEQQAVIDGLKAKINACTSDAQLKAFMLADENKAQMQRFGDDIFLSIRTFAVEKLKQLELKASAPSPRSPG